MSKEVSCRCIYPFFEPIRKKKIPDSIWLKDIPYSIEHLHNRHERVEWDTFCQICTNIRPYFPEEDFIEMGRRWSLTTVAKALFLIPKLLMRTKNLVYIFSIYVDKFGSTFFTCIDYETTEINRNTFKHTLVVKSGYQYCQEFFLISLGSLKPIFMTYCGRRKIRIELKWINRGAEFYVISEEKSGWYYKIKNFIKRPFAAQLIAKELEENNATLLKNYQELEKAQIILQRQTRQLKTAFEINQQIRKTLDLDSVLHSVIQAMVNIAGYVATEIIINIDSTEKIFEKKIQSGKIPTDMNPIIESLSIADNKIGEIKVWPSVEFSHIEAKELFEQIVPTIRLAIHDAITYQTVIDYRNNLERKVIERTAELEKARDELSNTVELLKSAQSSRNRFFANISHEFRTPLTLILGPIKKLLDSMPEKTSVFGGELKQELSMMQRNAQRLYRLINQLLDLSKLEAGSMTLQIDKINIVNLVCNYAQSFESLARQKSIKYVINCPERDIEAYVDQDKIEKILNNLLSNAFKFTPEGGEISVSIRNVIPAKAGIQGKDWIPHQVRDDSNDMLQIIISDTGVGIPSDRIDKIFDRFYQVDDSQKREHEGTGIGLALVKELVELHHGHINVQSEAGKGSTFTVSIPLGKEHFKESYQITSSVKTEKSDFEMLPIMESEPVENEITEDIISYSDQAKPIILIVEDNTDMRTYIGNHLKSEYKLVEAKNGNDGAEAAINKIPDLIISDVMMPSMDGFEFCQIIKQDQRTCHIPVILLTARASSEDKIEGLEYGADDYLTKPFDVNELKIRISNLLKQREQLRKYYSKNFSIDMLMACSKPVNAKFYNRVNEIVSTHLSEPEFNVKQFAREIGFSQSQLKRIIEAISGLSPAKFIRSQRLLYAKQMLDQQTDNISQIAYECGFNNLSYFSLSFKEQFGQLPSEFLRNQY